MPRSSLTARPVAAVLVAASSAAAAVLMFAPAPTLSLWLAHVVALETSLATTLLATFALVLAPRAAPRARRATLLLAWPATVAGLAPFVAAAPLWHASGGVSLREYVLGADVAPVVEQRDVALDPGSPDLLADVYRAPGAGVHPFVVVIHGGSWRSGDKGQCPWVSRALARAGITVLDVRHRLAPQHSFPAAIADVKCLLGRARERAEDLGIDPKRSALLGRSAGGQIALVAAYSAGDGRLPPSCDTSDAPVQAVVGIYPPTDLAWGYDHPVRPDVVRGPEALESYLGGAPTRTPEAYRLATPQSWVDGRPLPPTLLIHGTLDGMVSVEHSDRLARTLEARGAAVGLMRIPLADHGFDGRSGGLAEQLARTRILEFLGKL